ncbi:EF-hand domain-containing protein [Polynucleobacter sp.]|uniref:EF-hand domain-containing protein n=1 Tax=Polynucleobacter sp. TaxID=2029855 RepID=UPI003015E405
MKFSKIATVLFCLFPITVFSQAATPTAQVVNPIVVKKYSFKNVDFSGDKKISREEAKKAGISDAEFNQIDKDHSGFITWSEAVNSPSKNWTE